MDLKIFYHISIPVIVACVALSVYKYTWKETGLLIFIPFYSLHFTVHFSKF